MYAATHTVVHSTVKAKQQEKDAGELHNTQACERELLSLAQANCEIIELNTRNSMKNLMDMIKMHVS